MSLLLKYTEGIAITGAGEDPVWNGCEWVNLHLVGGDLPYQTRFKSMYSPQGLYFLFDCEDKFITCSSLKDFANLYVEDVIEIFLQPDRKIPVYFEYELSPLNFELPLLVLNHDMRYHGWLPFQYDGGRKALHKTVIKDGAAGPFSKCAGWTAELFLPFSLLEGMTGSLPQSGTIWWGNVCRIDYDSGNVSRWVMEEKSPNRFS